jgi:serine/threonine protein phosphatase PrpC
MSRALGDQRSADIGIIPTPDVLSARLSEGDLFVILASDGVWEFVSSQEAVEVVYERQGSGQSAQALVDLAAIRWKERSNRSDDITAIVVFLG